MSKRDIDAQKDDNLRRAWQIAEATGEPIEYIDEFTTVAPLDISVMDRLPKCLKPKPLKPKDVK